MASIKNKTFPLTFHEFNIKDLRIDKWKVMISTAFKIELIEDEIPSTGPYISFVGKVYSRPKQDDCVFGINVSEYNNNFNFTNKGKKLAPKLEIGKLVFIAILAKMIYHLLKQEEIDLLENSIDDLPNTSLSQSLFSRTQKFKTNKPISIKKEKSLDNEIEKVLSTGSKRKNQLAELSLRRLKKAKNLDNNDEEFGLDSQVTVILESLRLYAFSLWNFLSDELTEKWMYSEVYNYYKNKDNKTLSEVLIKIRKDLKHFSKKELKPHLREKAKNILDNWDVSIELVNQKVLSITIRKRVVLLYFQVPGLRSAGSGGGGTCYVPFLNIKQLVC
ncbi:15612_t:CDS:2 [Rhizophagus irregularis]|nr:15612_t:CDS:2 [Rhizophagus irregularis]